MCVASILAKKILSGDEAFVNQYVELLKLGNKDPYKILKDLGIDIQLTDFIDEMHTNFKEELIEYEDLLVQYKAQL